MIKTRMTLENWESSDGLPNRRINIESGESEIAIDVDDYTNYTTEDNIAYWWNCPSLIMGLYGGDL